MERSTCEEDRCQTQGSNCIMKKHEDSEFCLSHGGNLAADAKARESASKYQLNLYQARLKRHATNDTIKDLRDEIGLLRMMIEARINQCTEETDLIIQSSAIAELVMKVEKLVTSCHRIETLTGELMDRTSLLEFASKVIDIVATNCDAETADTIALGIVGAAAKEQN